MIWQYSVIKCDIKVSLNLLFEYIDTDLALESLILSIIPLLCLSLGKSMSLYCLLICQQGNVFIVMILSSDKIEINGIKVLK